MNIGDLKSWFYTKALAISSYLIPKKENKYLFIFHRKRNFSGNMASLINYIREYHPEIEVNIIGPQKVLKEINKFPTLKKITGGKSKFKALIQSKFIIIDDVDQGKLGKGNFPIVQLWHGVGFKKIFLIDEKISKENKERLRQYFQHYIMFAATSKEDVIEKNMAFGIKVAKVTGYPRNDIFYNNEQEVKKVKKKLNLEKYSRIITYAPTFRRYKNSQEHKEPVFSENFWVKLEDYLVRNNSIFIINKHPHDDYFNPPKDRQNIIDFTDSIDDVQNLLLVTDLLISDYSSIIMDFAITQRPFLCFAYDLEDYTGNCRSFYRDIKETLPKEIILYDESDLLKRIMTPDWFKTKELKSVFSDFSKDYHQYQDGNSSKRIMDELLKL